MSAEHHRPNPSQKPYEVFGLTEQETLNWWLSDERFKAILDHPETSVLAIERSSNDFGEFLFITTGRRTGERAVFMTFYGLGYHGYREKWITDEWYWYQAYPHEMEEQDRIDKKEAGKQIAERLEDIRPHIREDIQTERGKLFETLAALTDEDAAKAELEDFQSIAHYLEMDEEEIVPPTGENLLDEESRQRLPDLYSSEEYGLEAKAQIKFFTPDAQWTWYASEFDGEDIFFGLVVGLEIELGYFSLSELQSVRGPMNLQIERDLYFEPKTLQTLMEQHKKERGEL